MNKFLRDLLKFLEYNLNTEKQSKIGLRHKNALDWRPVDILPLVITFPYPKSNHFQPFSHCEIFDNPEKMLFNELLHGFDTSIYLHSKINDDLPYTIRANFGTVLIASIFGGHVEQRGDNPPWVKNFETLDEFKTIFDRNPMDYSQGYVSKALDTYRFYNQVLSDYPNLKKCIKIVLPDLQGPLDTLELLRGSELFTDFIINPELVDKGLSLMAKAQVKLAKHLQQFTTDGPEGYSHQHATTIKGNILIRNDSAIMISPEMYSDQVLPYDELVLKEMNGGGMHSCGRIDFNLPEIFRINSLKCFDFGQSFYNDLDHVYSLASEKKISLIRIRVTKEELLTNQIKENFPTGVSLVYDAASFEEAQSIVKSYYGY